jgi:hypothetical protein
MIGIIPVGDRNAGMVEPTGLTEPRTIAIHTTRVLANRAATANLHIARPSTPRAAGAARPTTAASLVIAATSLSATAVRAACAYATTGAAGAPCTRFSRIGRARVVRIAGVVVSNTAGVFGPALTFCICSAVFEAGFVANCSEVVTASKSVGYYHRYSEISI